jgi:hypothetical protein
MIIHRTWPALFTQEPEQMITTMQEVAAMETVQAIIINQAVANTNAAIDAARATNPDLFIISINAAEDPFDVAQRADIAFDINNLIIGEPLVLQAMAMGAETVVHYTFPRHMGVPMLALRRDVMRATAEANGLNWVDAEAPDPTGDSGVAATQMHIMQDIPRMVEEHGPNTVFFGTNCGMMTPMIEQVIEMGAIFAQPCCPSPYHAFPLALGIQDTVNTGEVDEDGEPIYALRNLREVLDATSEAIAARGMSGRLSNWAVPAGMMWTNVAVEYALAVINGDIEHTPGTVDEAFIQRHAEQYIYDTIGEHIAISLDRMEMDGRRIEHFVLGLVGFFVY